MRLRLLRLMLALCALGAALASPAAAARAMAAPVLAASSLAAPVMPCHESVAAQPASSVRSPHTGPQGSAPAHLCCVLTQAAPPPLAAPALPVPEAVSVRPVVPAAMVRAGLTPPIPVPPPRLL